jgi:hypothetical protein
MILDHYDTPEYANTVFILGGHALDTDVYLKRHRNRQIIYYQMEQMFRDPNQKQWWDVDLVIKRINDLQERGGAILWDIDHLNAEFLSNQGIKVNKVAPLRYTKKWEELTNSHTSDIDVLFYGSLNTRRSEVLWPVLNSLYYDKVTTMILVGGDLHRLKEYIERSKIILNIHHTAPYNRQEQPRIAYLLANKKCVLSEPSQHNYYEGGILESNDLANSIRTLLKDDQYRMLGQRGYEVIQKC